MVRFQFRQYSVLLFVIFLCYLSKTGCQDSLRDYDWING